MLQSACRLGEVGAAFCAIGVELSLIAVNALTTSRYSSCSHLKGLNDTSSISIQQTLHKGT